MILISCIGTCIYFVAGVSSVYPPIKNYEYLGSFNQFISGIQKYSSANPTVVYKITDTVGNKDNGYAIYMTIQIHSITRNVMYDLKCEESKDEGRPNITEIKLVGVHDMTKDEIKVRKNIDNPIRKEQGVKPRALPVIIP